MSLNNPVTPPGIDPRTVQLVAQRFNHYATPGPQTHGYSQANLLVAICKNKLLMLVVMCMHNHYFMLTKLTALVGVNEGTTKYLFVVSDSTAVCKKRTPNTPEHQTSSISTSLFCHKLMVGHFLATTNAQMCWNLSFTIMYLTLKERVSVCKTLNQ
jgi:hypothetical protein